LEDGVTENPNPRLGEKKEVGLSSQTQAVLLNFLTFLFIVVTGYVSHRALQTETEEKLLPLVVMGTQDDFTDEKNTAHTMVVRNVGFGPALNAVTRDVHVGDKWLQLNHRTVIAAGDIQDIGSKKSEGGKPFEDITTPLGGLKRVPPVGTIEELIKGKVVGVITCTSYENARREEYETWHWMYLTSSSGLAIDYVCQQKTPDGCSSQEMTRVQGEFANGDKKFEKTCRAGREHFLDFVR
jgi:hypothetical protein